MLQLVRWDGLLWVVAARPTHSSLSSVSVMISSSLSESLRGEEEVKWERGNHACQQCVTDQTPTNWESFNLFFSFIKNEIKNKEFQIIVFPSYFLFLMFRYFTLNTLCFRLCLTFVQTNQKSVIFLFYNYVVCHFWNKNNVIQDNKVEVVQTIPCKFYLHYTVSLANECICSTLNK